MKTKKEKSSIVIRADGSKEIGLGHLKRAVLICEYLLSTRNIHTFLLSKIDDQIIPFIENTNIELVKMNTNCNIKEEIHFISKLVNDIKPIYFILDVLENDINLQYMNDLKKMKIPIIAITDDSYKREINADLILNGNPKQLKINYSTGNYKYLLGPKYFLMSSEYENLNFFKPTNNNFKRVLLSVGGSDHNDLIFLALDALGIINEIQELIIISSKVTGYIERIKEYLKKIKKQTKLFLDVPCIAPYFKKVDIAITAGGNTLFERIASHIPGATICQLKRQMEIADCFEELKVNYNIGFGPELSVSTIQEKFQNFINNYQQQLIQHEQSKKIIDGKGLIRFCEKLDQL